MAPTRPPSGPTPPRRPSLEDTLNILIVESAAKARTLGRYLDSEWKVVATGGHVQTLPNDRSAHGKDAKKAYWANRPGELPSPPWVWTDRGEAALEKILEHADSDTTFWIATDPDREGEFIAWCLERLLEPHAREIHRITFQEVTEEAVQAAVADPRPVDAAMVDSALLRKFLDRLVGYRTSKLARSVIPGGSASMGRVQTPTLGFVVERELEREAHVPIPYFEVRARAATLDLQVRFHEPDDDDVWRNDAGRAVPTRTFDEAAATAAEEAIRSAGQVEVTEVKRGRRTSSPKAPFTTDALLQAAGSRFGWSPRKTSALASMLYEAGHLTYIRTDSERLAQSAIVAARDFIETEFGEDHLGSEEGRKAPSGPGGPVQDAHEAIRPTRLGEAEVAVDDADARRLYRLVRAHTLASLMAPSRYETARIETRVDGLERPITGSLSWRTFAGWEAAYAEFRDEPATTPPDAPLETGATWVLDPEEEGHPNPQLIEDETQPPSRYRRHTLIRAMKEAGIGRPSTYARTVEKLEERRYVEVDDGALMPTERGRAVWLQAAPLYTRGESKTELFSPEFTAVMEGRLDDVARSQGHDDGDGVSRKGKPDEGSDGVGETPAAAEIWERWRDEIRELHDIARERKKAGSATPRTVEQLDRLLENAPEAVEAPDEATGLSEADARDWIERLREAGVEPSPTERQMEYLENLMEALDLSPEEAGEIIGLASLAEVQTSRQASALIEELAQLRDERRPPSPKQLGLIERLRKEAELTEAEAAALVDESDFESLTGGREGSASALIDQLLEKTGKGKGDGG